MGLQERAAMPDYRPKMKFSCGATGYNLHVVDFDAQKNAHQNVLKCSKYKR